MSVIKKVFLKDDGVFSINGYEDALFFYNKKLELDFHRDLKVDDNLNFIKENGLKCVYYEVSEMNIIFRDCLREVKQPTKHECCELPILPYSKRIPEVADIILNDEKILFLLRTLMKGGAETSLVNINKILGFFNDSEIIRKKLVKKYIIALCHTYAFHQINNVKYFEFLLINKLSVERIIF